MKRLPVFRTLLVLVGAGLFATGCSSTSSKLPPGAHCSGSSDCASAACVSGFCAGHLADGGFIDGGTLPDGGIAGGGTLPDGGSTGGSADGGCVNLQCQQASCPKGSATTLKGHVYDPSGQVPLYNAVVYVPNGTKQPFTEGVQCGSCAAGITGSPLVITLTGSDGAFSLQNVPAGTSFPIIYQIGKWRRQVTIPAVTACATTDLGTVDSSSDHSLQRLPRNSSEGDIPQIAISTGAVDPMECLLLKMGISSSEFTDPSASGRVHMYQENGLKLDGGTPPGSALYMSPTELAKHDVVIFPCEGAENPKPDAGQGNLVNYSLAGGRIFATHYSYVWTAYPGATPFDTTATWTPDNGAKLAPPDGTPFTIDTGFPKGQAFDSWLQLVGALDSNGQLDITSPRADVASVNPVATRWIYGNNPTTSRSNVEHLTWNMPLNPPALPDGGTGEQCGRVVFSDFHVANTALVGSSSQNGTFPHDCSQQTVCTSQSCFTGQEKALMFMLFDVSACVQSDNTVPSVCPGAGQSCSTSNICCSGLLCADSTGANCAPGATCSCVVPPT